jgi:hypothetical protein
MVANAVIDNAAMIAERLKAAVETGLVADLIGLYAPDAHLDARLAGPRGHRRRTRRHRGGLRVVVARAGPARPMGLWLSATAVCA